MQPNYIYQVQNVFAMRMEHQRIVFNNKLMNNGIRHVLQRHSCDYVQWLHRLRSWYRIMPEKKCDAISAIWYIDGLLQDCSNSSALAMELLQSCTEPPIKFSKQKIV